VGPGGGLLPCAQGDPADPAGHGTGAGRHLLGRWGGGAQGAHAAGTQAQSQRGGSVRTAAAVAAGPCWDLGAGSRCSGGGGAAETAAAGVHLGAGTLSDRGHDHTPACV